jgi:hypothetical protein
VPVVACAVPLLDTSLAVIRRFLNNKPLFAADRDHIHHKLLDKGLSQRQAVLLLYGVSALFGFLSLALLRRTNSTLAFVLVVAGVVMALGIRRLGYHEIDELHMATRRTIQQRKTIANNLAVRRAISSLKTADSLPQICAALDAVCKQSDFENFEIFLEGQNGFQDEAYLAPFRRERGGLRFTCSKQSNVLRPWNVSAGWKVQLDLVSDHHRHGSFTAYRPYDTAAVSIEMNLLVADFRVALANAIERASYLSRCRAA